MLTILRPALGFGHTWWVEVAAVHLAVGKEAAAALVAIQLSPGGAVSLRGTAQGRNAVKFGKLPESVVRVGEAHRGRIPPSLFSERGASDQQEAEQEQHLRALPRPELFLRLPELDATASLDAMSLIMNMNSTWTGVSCLVLHRKRKQIPFATLIIHRKRYVNHARQIPDGHLVDKPTLLL